MATRKSPSNVREGRPQYQFRESDWIGILNGKIIGPFELPRDLTGQLFGNFTKGSS